jgi:hypothetical protein
MRKFKISKKNISNFTILISKGIIIAKGVGLNYN